MEAQSEAAQAASAAARERMLEAGRQPGWTLDINPTPALIADAGLVDAESYRAAQRLVERHRASEYRTQREATDHEQDRQRSNDDDDRSL
ncbi:hypothetical protein H7I94_12700 [Mycobacterium szulgai]|nr:hypothetical protein [Mycobacterium szulgai]